MVIRRLPIMHSFDEEDFGIGDGTSMGWDTWLGFFLVHVLAKAGLHGVREETSSASGGIMYRTTDIFWQLRHL